MRNSKRGSRSAITLIEVVAGTAIAGLLLATVIVGASRQIRLIQHVSKKEAALQNLDEFLHIWSRSHYAAVSLTEAADGAALAPAGVNTFVNTATQSVVKVSVQPQNMDRSWLYETIRIDVVTDTDRKLLTSVELVRPLSKD